MKKAINSDRLIEFFMCGLAFGLGVVLILGLLVMAVE